MIGLIIGFITLVGIGEQDDSHLSFKRGSVIGAATFFWFHGVLYTQVPVALGSIPGVNRIPMALVLLLLLGAGAAFMAWAIWPAAKNFRWLRWAGILTAITLFIHIPHDLFRRMMPGPSNLPATQRRLMIVSIDALRRDTFEQAMPDWKAPNGITPICAFPATRMAWNTLLGASVERMRFGRVMPYQSELQKPDELTLLRIAEVRGVRTAFVIDDSLTPSYSLQPSLFTTVLEPDGGWKYWFTLGYGTSWPAYSWLQNYLSPVETTNPWSNTNAYYRDLGRQLKNHAWVSTHNCELHAPIILRFEELRTLSGWKWLGRSAYSYEPYFTLDEIRQDRGIRVGPRASAQRHFNVRAGFLLTRLKPFLQAWEREYPELSGVVTADHGETFPGIFSENHQSLSTFSGVHGFRLDADAIYVPLHPFGRTTCSLQPGALFSWLDLRDDIGTWLNRDAPLDLASSQTGRVIQLPSIRTDHLESPADIAQVRKPSDAASTGPVSRIAPSPGRGGIHPEEMMSTITFLSNGLWFCDDPSREAMAQTVFSTALASGSRLVLYNPENDGTYIREDWDGYRFIGFSKYVQAQVERDLQTFNTTHQLPLPPKE